MSYATIVEQAREVAGWTYLGVALPEPLQQRIDLFETVEYLEVGAPLAVPELYAEHLLLDVEEFAAQLATHEHMLKAKEAFITRAAQQLNSFGRTWQGRVRELLEPQFEVAVTGYTDAICRLPETLSADEIVKAGPDALEALREAQMHVRTLKKISSWLGGSDPVLRLLKPTRVQLGKVEAAAAANPRLTTIEAELNPVWIVAAQSGVEFAMHFPKDVTALRQQLELAVPPSRR